MTEPDDLAATGIEIVARPPGKKAQPLSMLSGGERALTAVALLFSMLEVHPVPFCVLDEVDAALDEANVGRFADALRGLADQTQFIVITHNRGTIENADALYGVTVGDDAVSRVISLKLEEARELADQVAKRPRVGGRADGRLTLFLRRKPKDEEARSDRLRRRSARARRRRAPAGNGRSTPAPKPRQPADDAQPALRPARRQRFRTSPARVRSNARRSGRGPGTKPRRLHVSSARDPSRADRPTRIGSRSRSC